MFTNSNHTHHFTVDFKSETVYATLWDLIKKFNQNGIEKVELEIYGWTIKQEKFSWYFKHEVGEIQPYEIGNRNPKIGNLLAMAEEHGNEQVYFNIWYQKPYELEDNVIEMPGTEDARG